MNRYDKRLIERLRNWERVYPEDQHTPEGNLYVEAAERIVELLVAYSSAEEELKEETSKSNELEYTLDYDQDGLWLLQDGKHPQSLIPQSLFDERIRQVIRQSKSLDQLAKYDQEDDLIMNRKVYLIYKEDRVEPFAVTLVKDHSETIVNHFLNKGENVRKDSMRLVETFDDVRKVIGLKGIE